MPDAPADIKATPVTGDTIILSWTQPDMRRGEVLSYTLYKQFERSVSTLTVPGTERQFTFKGRAGGGERSDSCCLMCLGLEFGELYEFWIVAHTIIGEGARSKVVSARPIHDGNNIV